MQRLCLPSAFKAQHRGCALNWSAWARCVSSRWETEQGRSYARAICERQPRPQFRKVQHLHATGGQRAREQVTLLGRRASAPSRACQGRAAACLRVELHARHVPGRARVLQCRSGSTDCRRAAA